MKSTISILFRVYSNVPYAFFAAFLLVVTISALLNNTVVINDSTFDILPLAVLATTCAAGIFAFPIVAVAALLYNKRNWKKLSSPALSYGLYIAAVYIAGSTGWWVD